MLLMLINLINNLIQMFWSALFSALVPIFTFLNNISFEGYTLTYLIGQCIDLLGQGINVVRLFIGEFPFALSIGILSVELIFDGVIWVLAIVKAVKSYVPVA